MQHAWRMLRVERPCKVACHLQAQGGGDRGEALAVLHGLSVLERGSQLSLRGHHDVPAWTG